MEKLRVYGEVNTEEGIAYQTLIASIIQKYISNQLVEERDIYHAIKILQ